MSNEDENTRKRINALEEEVNALRIALGIDIDKRSQTKASQTDVVIEGLVRANQAQTAYLKRLVENTELNNELLKRLLDQEESVEAKTAKLIFDNDLPATQFPILVLPYLSALFDLQHIIDDLMHRPPTPIKAQISLNDGRVIEISLPLIPNSFLSQGEKSTPQRVDLKSEKGGLQWSA